MLGIFFGALVLFAASCWAAVVLGLPAPFTVAVGAVAIFMMFTVVHDASHSAISSHRLVNSLFGRAAMLFVSPAMAFSAWAFIHIEHHRWANDEQHDPDTFASHGRWWQLPARWAAMDVPYVAFYLKHQSRRPRVEVAENTVMLAITVAIITIAVITGTFWWLVMLYLIPERIAVLLLAWWFDWLPHHGLADTQKDNRYRATRVRVGMEWLLSPVMLSQNYHLVHHLHPSIPFHRYAATWRKNQEAYLQQEAAIATVFGQQLSPDEFREWKELNSRLARVLPLRRPRTTDRPSSEFHKVRIDQVSRLTDDSVLITFDMSDEQKEQFRFAAGQHVTVRTELAGVEVRRSYSICGPPSADKVMIAVKRIPGGAFSTFALEQLRTGDSLELMSPSGRFGVHIDPDVAKHYAAFAAGSGITPILSILHTVLESEPQSRFTLICANRSVESIMFKQTLDELHSRFSDRLQVTHVLSRDPGTSPALRGRIDSKKLHQWLDGPLRPETVDEWLLCGPAEFVMLTRESLVGSGVDVDHIHIELFSGYRTPAPQMQFHNAATVSIRLAGSERTFRLSPGETILEAALQLRTDVPYGCMGGACGTCKAKLVSGAVEMEQNFALPKSDLDAGYVLTCQSRPTSDTVHVDYDA